MASQNQSISSQRHWRIQRGVRNWHRIFSEGMVHTSSLQSRPSTHILLVLWMEWMTARLIGHGCSGPYQHTYAQSSVVSKVRRREWGRSSATSGSAKPISGDQTNRLLYFNFKLSTSNDKGRTRRETKTLSGNGHFSGYGTPTNSLPNHSPLIPTHCLPIPCPSRLHPT